MGNRWDGLGGGKQRSGGRGAGSILETQGNGGSRKIGSGKARIRRWPGTCGAEGVRAGCVLQRVAHMRPVRCWCRGGGGGHGGTWTQPAGSTLKFQAWASGSLPVSQTQAQPSSPRHEGGGDGTDPGAENVGTQSVNLPDRTFSLDGAMACARWGLARGRGRGTKLLFLLVEVRSAALYHGGRPRKGKRALCPMGRLVMSLVLVLVLWCSSRSSVSSSVG